MEQEALYDRLVGKIYEIETFLGITGVATSELDNWNTGIKCQFCFLCDIELDWNLDHDNDDMNKIISRDII